MGDLAYLLTSVDLSVPWDPTAHASFRSGLANLTRDHLTFLVGSSPLEHHHLTPGGSDLDPLWSANLNLVLERSGEPDLESEKDDLTRALKGDLNHELERDGGDLVRVWESDPDPNLALESNWDLDPKEIRRVMLRLVQELRSMSHADLQHTHQASTAVPLPDLSGKGDLRRPAEKGGESHTGSPWKASRSQGVISQKVSSRSGEVRSRKVRSPQGHPLLPGRMMQRMMIMNPGRPHVG